MQVYFRGKREKAYGSKTTRCLKKQRVVFKACVCGRKCKKSIFMQQNRFEILQNGKEKNKMSSDAVRSGLHYTEVITHDQRQQQDLHARQRGGENPVL